jgi:hypothetical protein
VKGFICGSQLTATERVECPLLSKSIIADAGQDAEQLWKPWTISVMSFGLAALWLFNFILLSTTVGAFIVYQSTLGDRANLNGRPS